MTVMVALPTKFFAMVTLPFLSAGGTSTGTLYLAIGVVLSVYVHSGKDRLFG